MSISQTDIFMAETFGIDTYRVGGSVRDEIIGRNPKDADYVVRGYAFSDIIGLLARENCAVSPLTLRTGHVIGVRASRKDIGSIEVALPRKEVSTGPGRHDFDIVVDPAITLHEDCTRRDFTINALYKHVANGVVADPTARGLYDLQHRLVNTTHPDSFRDDPLRMLRALRFVSCLGFDLSKIALGEMRMHSQAATGLNAGGNMSGTVWNELAKLLMGDDVAKALRVGFFADGPLAVLFPEVTFKDFHDFDPLETAAKMNAPLRVRLMLLYRNEGPEAWMIDSGRLTNLPKDIRRDVRVMLENPVPLKGGGVPSRARFMRVEFGDDLSKDMILAKACSVAHHKSAQNALGLLGSLEDARRKAADRKVPASISELQIGGKDVMSMGFEGRAIREVLLEVLRAVNREPTDENLTFDGQSKIAWELS